MKDLLDAVVTGPFKEFIQQVIDFLPNLISSLIILIVGLIISWLIEKLLIKLLDMFKTDKFAQRAGLTKILEKGGVKEGPSHLVGRISYWIVLIIFINMSLYTLKILALEELLESFFLYLPNLFIAVLLIVVGYMLSNFLSRAALIASVNAGIGFAGLISRGVKITLILLVMTMALEQLGIGHDTVIIAFAVIFGGVVLALSLAFGLGGQDIAKEYLKKISSGGAEESDDIHHL